MPDLLTHLFIGISIVLFLRIDSQEKAILIILGSLLPDIERPLSVFLLIIGANITLTSVTHSLIGSIGLCYVSAALMASDTLTFWKRFKILILGYFGHLIADMTLWPWEELGLFLLFPLKIVFSFNLVWPDYEWFPIIALMLVGISGSYYFSIMYIQHLLNREKI